MKALSTLLKSKKLDKEENKTHPPAEMASVSQTTSARSGLRPAARRPPYIPAA